jgi:opacity protein-like surface antigen
MKKFIFLILTALFFVCLSNNIFAADFSISAGGGGLLGYTFTRYTLEGEDVKSTQSMDRLDYAGFLFFDATYAEFSVMIQGGKNSYKENMIYTAASLADTQGTGTETNLGFSLLGKYPIAINKTLTWFPAFGVEYQIALTQRRKPSGESGDYVYDRSKGQLPEDRDKDDKPYPISAWNSFWIDIGAGLDFNITSKLFLRGELLFGFRLPTNYELGALEVVQNPPMNVKNPSLAGLTGGPELKLGIGYHF